MGKYRKKPVVIEAFQMTKERRWDNSEWPNWLNEAWNKGEKDTGAVSCGKKLGTLKEESLYILSLEGWMEVSWNDYIIQGVQGELYPCKPDIFDATYDKL